MAAHDPVLYWDTSAVMSALFRDAHSATAVARSRIAGIHFVSSLTWAETHAVIARIERERALADVLVNAAREALEAGPWRRVHISPDWQLIEEIARKWPLRGADVWHVATAKTLQAQIAELRMFSFDARLAVAAKGEGLV